MHGIAALRQHKFDIMLVNMQYNPSTGSVINFEPYLEAMRHAADLEDVYLFRRYEIMRYWSETGIFDFVDVPKEPTVASLRGGSLSLPRRDAGGSDRLWRASEADASRGPSRARQPRRRAALLLIVVGVAAAASIVLAPAGRQRQRRRRPLRRSARTADAATGRCRMSRAASPPAAR